MPKKNGSETSKNTTFTLKFNKKRSRKKVNNDNTRCIKTVRKTRTRQSQPNQIGREIEPVDYLSNSDSEDTIMRAMDVTDESVATTDDMRSINANVDNESYMDDNLDETGEVDDEDMEIVSDEESSYKNKCLYKHAHKSQYQSDSSDEDINIENIFDDDIDEAGNSIVSTDNRITKPYMTKYERVRILGDRTKQIALGAKPLIKNIRDLTPRQIAEEELKHKIIPLIIERPLPNGNKERWYVSELIQV